MLAVSQESKTHGASTYQALAKITFPNVPLAKTSHMTNFRVNVGGNYIKTIDTGMYESQNVFTVTIPTACNAVAISDMWGEMRTRGLKAGLSLCSNIN